MILKSNIINLRSGQNYIRLLILNKRETKEKVRLRKYQAIFFRRICQLGKISQFHPLLRAWRRVMLKLVRKRKLLINSQRLVRWQNKTPKKNMLLLISNSNLDYSIRSNLKCKILLWREKSKRIKTKNYKKCKKK